VDPAIVAGLVLWVLYDVTQKKHAILRNFPIIGHFRYWLETVGPELRQYIVTNNDEEKPFSRDQRRWIYASAKKENNYFGFGTDNDIEATPHYLIIKHDSLAPLDLHGDDPEHTLPCAKVLGAHRGRPQRFRPTSVINVSAMSFGSLSSNAVEALNRGCSLAGCLQNTGEGGIAPHHLKGGELVWQIGTGYFGCRDGNGRFDLERFKDACERHPVRAVEIKLSQGAKPGLGGILPAGKITPEIAQIRGIPMGRDCVSPPRHSAFGEVDEMLDFVELLAEATGLPIGIKSAVGSNDFWWSLAREMGSSGRGVDFITIDGGEGGTGAAPLVFADHVALPFRIGFARVYRIFAEQGLHEQVVFIGSGKLGMPEAAFLGLALGCDLINVARSAMLAVGCIQAQRCHSGHCPTGVATQNGWLVRGLDPKEKAPRVANYVRTLRKELLRLSHACGVEHPALLGSSRIEFLQPDGASSDLLEVFDYEEGWGRPSLEDREAIREEMRVKIGL